MLYTAASHQGAVMMFWLDFSFYVVHCIYADDLNIIKNVGCCKLNSTKVVCIVLRHVSI